MQHPVVTVFNVLWHVAQGINETSEALHHFQTHDYANALLHAMRAVGHLYKVMAQRESLRAIGATLASYIKRVRHQAAPRIKNFRSQESDADDR
jgi:hypothetical protein